MIKIQFISGAPIAPLIHVFTPFFGRIHVVTHVEVVFSRARTSCCSLLDLMVRRHDMQYDRRFFPYAAGGGGGGGGGAKP